MVAVKKRIALRIAKETLSAGNQPKYFRVDPVTVSCYWKINELQMQFLLIATSMGYNALLV